MLPDSGGTLNPNGPIREVTVKSFSMSAHIRRPGFQLLSLIDPAQLANPDLKSFADTPCSLPDQYRIYTSFYAPCVLFTFLVLVLLKFSKARFRTFRKPARLSLSPATRSSSGHASPILMADPDWSATRSPYSPASSPRGTLPPLIRTPHTPVSVASTLVASQPGTPNPASSSFVLPLSYSDRDEEDEEDTLYPAQYAARRDIRVQCEDEDWSHVGQDMDGEPYEMGADQEAVGGNSLGHRIHSEFISAPDHARSARGQKWSWSYTFMFKGRMRRITLRLPSWTSVHDFFDFFELGSDPVGILPRRRRDRWMSVLLDALGVFWPAVIVWVIINWTIL